MSDDSTTGGKQVYVDEDTCIGCTLCTQLAPHTFEMGDDGKSHAKNSGGDSKDAIRGAIEACPVQCIHLQE